MLQNSALVFKIKIKTSILFEILVGSTISNYIHPSFKIIGTSFLSNLLKFSWISINPASFNSPKICLI